MIFYLLLAGFMVYFTLLDISGFIFFKVFQEDTDGSQGVGPKKRGFT